MVARAIGYYGTAFCGERGETQRDLLPPTIFNVVLEVVVLHWVAVTMEWLEDPGERGQEGMHQDALFYADDGMVASSDPRCLQGAFDTLVSFLNRVGLQTNVEKTVDMACRPYQEAGNQSEVAYGRRIMGEALTNRERQKGRVQFRECREEMAAGSVAGHTMTQHERLAEA